MCYGENCSKPGTIRQHLRSGNSAAMKYSLDLIIEEPLFKVLADHRKSTRFACR